jgi:hypothetical protein
MKAIFTQQNKQMKICLERNKKNKNSIKGNISKFSKLLLYDIVEYENSILLDNCICTKTKKQMMDFSDITSFEAFFNHIHVSDFIEGESCSHNYLNIGLAIAYVIKLKLKVAFPRKKFKIIVSYDITTNDDCTIRFHSIHKNEADWLSENLEDYKEEAIGVIEI